MLGIHEDPAESTFRELGAAAEDGLCHGCTGETMGNLVLYTSSAPFHGDPLEMSITPLRTRGSNVRQPEAV